MAKIICLDIGGMSTKVALFDNQKIIARNRIDYPKLTSSQHLLLEIDALLTTYNNKFEAIAISTCGIVDPITGIISGLSAIKNYNDTNFKKQLAKFNVPVYVENDANCAALGELKYGNAQKYKNVLCFIIGTGIGGALIFNKKIITTKNNMSGEFGCFLNCIDANGNYINYSQVCSSRAIEVNYQKLTNKNFTTKKLFELYEKDAIAKSVIDKNIFEVSKLILNASFVTDPEAIVIGGAISASNHYLSLIKNQITILLEKTGIKKNMVIVQASLNNDANLYGALTLVVKGNYEE